MNSDKVFIEAIGRAWWIGLLVGVAIYAIANIIG